MTHWPQFLAAMTLLLVRLSGVVLLAPFFSAAALPARTRAAFVLAVAVLLAPVAAGLPGAHAELCYAALIGELALGLVYGLTLALVGEMLLFAGQIVGLQFSFSLVNVLDPGSPIQTPIMGVLFELTGTLVLIAGGLDRLVLRSVIRGLTVAPLGTFVLAASTPMAIVHAAGGMLVAAVALAAPVLAATMLVEVAIALMGKLSPQLPVMSLSVPMKTLAGYALLTAALALWPRFLEARFENLLALADRLMALRGTGG